MPKKTKQANKSVESWVFSERASKVAQLTLGNDFLILVVPRLKLRQEKTT